MSREKNLAKNTSIIAIGTFFPKLAIFVTLPILTAYLTKEEYGSYDLVLTIVSLLVPTITLQIQSAAFRFLIDVKNEEKKISRVVTNIYAFIVPITIVSSLILFFVLNDLQINLRLAISLYLLFAELSNSNIQIIRGLTDNKTYAIGSIISSIGQFIFVIVFIMLFKTGLLGSIIAVTFAELITAIYIFIKGKLYKYINLDLVSSRHIKGMIAYSWPMVPNSLSQWVMHVSDRFVISLVLGIRANGLYAVAYKFPSILSFAQTTFNMAWQENASVYSKDKDVHVYYSSMFNTLFDIVSGSMALLIGITPFIFEILVRGNYSEAYPQIPILYMGILFFSLSSFWGGIFVAFKKTSIVAFTSIVAAVINLAIDILFMKYIGLYAASISTLVSYIFLCLLRAISVQKFLKLEYRFDKIILILALLIVQSVLSFKQNFIIDIFNLIFGLIMFVILNKSLLKMIIKKVLKIIKKK